MTERKMKKSLAWLLVGAWMTLIFMLSHQPGEVSGSKSGAIVEMVEEILFSEQSPLYGMKDSFNLHWWVRKSAHFVTYALLAALVWNALRFDVQNKGRLFRYSVGVAFGYAMFDETHQLFVEDRSGNLVDVLIDTVGAMFGSGLVWITLKLKKRRSHAKPPAFN